PLGRVGVDAIVVIDRRSVCGRRGRHRGRHLGPRRSFGEPPLHRDGDPGPASVLRASSLVLALMVGAVVGASPHAWPAPSTCGSSWSRVPSPSPAHGPGDANQLTGVDAISASDAWAVGWSYRSSDGHYRTLAEHWDG